MESDSTGSEYFDEGIPDIHIPRLRLSITHALSITLRLYKPFAYPLEVDPIG